MWSGGYVDDEPCVDALFLSEFKILGVGFSTSLGSTTLTITMLMVSKVQSSLPQLLTF